MNNMQTSGQIGGSGSTREKLSELYLTIVMNEATQKEILLWQTALQDHESAALALSVKEELDSLSKMLSSELSRPLSEAEKASFENARVRLSESLKSAPKTEPMKVQKSTFLSSMMNRFLILLESFDSENENSGARFGMPALALTGLVMLLFGGFIGYSTFAVASFFRGEMPVAQNTAIPVTNNEELANIRFSFSESEKDPISIYYDLITHVETKGSLSQSHIKDLLLYAFTKERNPGTRLEALSELQKIPNIFSDNDIKEALIKALKSDQNDGVRNQALALLLAYPPDSDIKMALLHSLMNDRNAGIRIAALNSLISVGLTGEKFDEEILASLKKKIQDDENKYIRYRANALFDEAPQEIEENK